MKKVRLGILWRGNRDENPSRPDSSRGLESLFDALGDLNVDVVPVVFMDDAIDEIRAQLLGLDGVLVWVNPIQDGATRGVLDQVLREVSAEGIFVSAHPDTILKLGTKEVLFHTRHLGWGSDCDLYRSVEDLNDRFPARLREHRRLVLKQARGNGGNGVWKVELLGPATAGSRDRVRVQDARVHDGSSEDMELATFMDRCEQYFAWSGSLVDQEYQERLADGMLRCYLSQDEVVGFCHQWPRGLLDMTADEAASVPNTVRSVMEGPGVPAYQQLRADMETQWVPQMLEVLGMDPDELPVIWDADFLYGPKSAAGEDSYVLCESNASAVWPFPSLAVERVAALALARIGEMWHE